MRFLLLLFTAAIAMAGDWNSVMRTRAGERIEVTTSDRKQFKADLVSANDDGLVVRTAAGEQKVARNQIRKIRVHDTGHRILKGIMWTAIGAAAGAAAGLAACPSCANEGHGSKYVGPGAAGGAAIGALGFLSAPYRTVYKAN